jgi:hypothetical protein
MVSHTGQHLLRWSSISLMKIKYESEHHKFLTIHVGLYNNN